MGATWHFLFVFFFNFFFVLFEIKNWNFICHIELLIIVCDQCGQGVSGACSVMTREVGRPSEMRCCHEECAGGCSGGQSNQCDVCKHVIHNDECRSVCPPGHYLVRILPLTSSKKLSLLSSLRWTCSSFQVRPMRIWSTDVAIFNYRFLLNYIRFNRKHKSRSFLCLHRQIFTEIGSSHFWLKIYNLLYLYSLCLVYEATMRHWRRVHHHATPTPICPGISLRQEELESFWWIGRMHLGMKWNFPLWILEMDWNITPVD